MDMVERRKLIEDRAKRRKEHDAETCKDESCGICEQVRDDEEKIRERENAYERYLAHCDDVYSQWKDEGRHDR